MTLLFIPSPPISFIQLGPFTIHFYAMCLLAGIAFAWWLGERRWLAWGGSREQYENILLVAVPSGIVGARIYHVLTHLGDYTGGPWWGPLAIWQGGIAIYGAIGGGALAAYLMCRYYRVRFTVLADALAPGIIAGQAIGRFGNWFNQELYGAPTTLPCAVEIAPIHRVPGFEQYATFHPTFLYESVLNLIGFAILLWAGRRFSLGRGKLFVLYVAIYTSIRFFMEELRLDPMFEVLWGIRFNGFMALLMALSAWIAFGWLVKNRPGANSTVARDTATALDTMDNRTGKDKDGKPGIGDE